MVFLLSIVHALAPPENHENKRVRSKSGTTSESAVKYIQFFAFTLLRAYNNQSSTTSQSQINRRPLYPIISLQSNSRFYKIS